MEGVVNQQAVTDTLGSIKPLGHPRNHIAGLQLPLTPEASLNVQPEPMALALHPQLGHLAECL